MKDREFVKCRQVLEGKIRALRDKNHGKRPNNLPTTTVTVQYEEHLWKNRVFSEQTPLDSMVSAHPQNISLSLPTDLKNAKHWPVLP